jgi:hypothetical protein
LAGNFQRTINSRSALADRGFRCALLSDCHRQVLNFLQQSQARA